MVLLSFVLLAAAACGGSTEGSAHAAKRERPRSPRDLAARVLDALRANSVEDYYKLMPSASELQSWCPGFEQTLEHYRKEAAEAFARCATLKWKGLSITEVKGGESKDSREDWCPALERASDLKVRLDKREFEIDNPMLHEDRFVVFAGPECGERR